MVLGFVVGRAWPSASRAAPADPLAGECTVVRIDQDGNSARVVYSARMRPVTITRDDKTVKVGDSFDGSALRISFADGRVVVFGEIVP